MASGAPVLSDLHITDALARAAAIARYGSAHTVNPQVGCVLVAADGRIVAEGWHNGAGTPHAEIAALAALPAEYDRSQLTAVVTLEPCNHTGRTGPCAQALLTAGVGAVIYGATEPGQAAGGGAAALENAGIPATYVAHPACAVLRADWLRRLTAKNLSTRNPSTRDASTGNTSTHATHPHPTSTDNALKPRVILKWAQSLDGRAAAADGSSQWITGAAALQDVHMRRAECAAIACGIGTLLADDPSLTARTADGKLLVPPAQQPLPVVFGLRKIPADSRLRKHPALPHWGLAAPLQYSGRDLSAALADLAKKGINTLFVEGGPTLISAFLRSGLYHELLVYSAPTLLGGEKLALSDIGVGNIAEMLRFNTVETVQLGGDILFRIIAAADAQHRNNN